MNRFKRNKQIKTWELNKLEYEMIASFLWCDINNVLNIYKNYSFEGLGLILLSNAYLVSNKIFLGKISDLEKIATSYSPKGITMLNYFFSSHFLEKKDTLYCSKHQLTAMNKYQMLSEIFIKEEEEVLKNIHTVYPPKKINNTSYMRKVLNNIISHVNKKLPEHIDNEIKMLKHSVQGLSVENFFRILNTYISMDESYIGFTDMLSIQLNILHKDKKVLLEVLKNNNVWRYDNKNGIIYDPVQRVERGLPASPHISEISSVFNRRMERYIEILNLK